VKHNVASVNADPSETGAPAGRRAERAWHFTGIAVSVAVSLFVSLASVWLGHRMASSTVVDLGPTDGRYASGFRDIERDGPAYFRWSVVPSSRLSLPVRFCGPGSIQLRVRRHFVDPAVLSVSVGGAIVGQKSIQARMDQPYEVIEFPVSRITCVSDTTVLLESSIQGDRPLGVAVDWIQLRSLSGFKPSTSALWRSGLVSALVILALGLAGGGRRTLGVAIGGLALTLGLGFATDPLVGERIVRAGLVALVLTLAGGIALSRLAEYSRLSTPNRIGLVAIVLVSLALRAAFLHPQAFYPDYRVHALVQQTYSSLGLPAFLDQLFEIQYARSLGLQQVAGNWYPFPYPPGPYFLIGAIRSGSGLDPLDAAIAAAAAAGALLPMATLFLGLRLGLSPAVALGGAFFIALQPLLIRRMALGYFPGVIGQLADALALLTAMGLMTERGKVSRRMWTLVSLLLGAFLIYTQSIANFGLLVATILGIELVRRSDQFGGVIRMSVAALMALVASFGAFYWRYVPVMENVANHRPQPESRVLDRLEQLRQNVPTAASGVSDEDLNDPYAGDTVNPIRGLSRLGSRLWRFNGPFMLAMLAGLWLVWKESDRARANLILGWISVCIWISLLTAGLPSPNGFQHLKDLEFVMPLFALGLALLTLHLWRKSRTAAWIFCAAWLMFAVRAFVIEFRDRLLPIAGF